MKLHKILLLACSISPLFLISHIAFADAPFQKYCISVPNVGDYLVNGNSATIIDTVAGTLAIYGTFSHKVCYENYTTSTAQLTTPYIAISGSVSAVKNDLSGPVYTPAFQCPNVDYTTWPPVEIEVTVHFDTATQKASCTIDTVVPRY